MKAWILFDRDLDSIAIGDLTWDYCHRVSDNEAVLTTGATLTNVGYGCYLLNNPNAIEDTLFSVHLTDDPTVFCEGAFTALGTQDLWGQVVPASFPPGTAGHEMGLLRDAMTQFVDAVGRLLAGTYHTGEISSPLSPVPSQYLVLFQETSYVGLATLGEKWAAILDTLGTEVYFTAKMKSEDRTPAIDVECEIVDAAAGIVKITLTRQQLDVRPGDYFFQLQARTYTNPEPPALPALDGIWIMQEGKLLVKPTFKG